MTQLATGTFENWTFTADSPLVSGVFPQPNHSGRVGKPCAFGLHDIECPPAVKQSPLNWFGRLYASLFGPDYLQDKFEQHSVQYGVFGNVVLQGIPESWWAWGMGTPCSKHSTHVEQSGYARFTEAQWRGRASAIGTVFYRGGDGRLVTYTAEMAEAMSSQFSTVAALYADWCKRNGYVPKLGTMDELIRTTRGEQLGILFTHAMASEVQGTTTSHTDPGSNYPLQDLVDLSFQIFVGKPPAVPGNSIQSNPTGQSPIPIPIPIIPPALEEEIMSYYKDKSDFENSMRSLAAKGVNDAFGLGLTKPELDIYKTASTRLGRRLWNTPVLNGDTATSTSTAGAVMSAIYRLVKKGN